MLLLSNPKEEGGGGGGDEELNANEGAGGLSALEVDYVEHADIFMVLGSPTTRGGGVSVASFESDRSDGSFFSTLSLRRLELLAEHFCFFFGASFGVLVGYMSLRAAKFAVLYPDQQYYDPFDQRFFGPWSVYDSFYIFSAVLYLTDALIHLWFVDSATNPHSRRFSRIFFGTAATCDLISTALWMRHREMAYSVLQFFVAYLYFFSAVSNMFKLKYFSIHWHRHQRKTGTKNKWRLYRTKSGKKVATFLGDVLFLIATIIDIIIAHLDYVVVTSQGQLVTSSFTMLSYALWFVDSLLYILADLIPTDHDYSRAMATSPHDGSIKYQENQRPILEHGNNPNNNNSNATFHSVTTFNRNATREPV